MHEILTAAEADALAHHEAVIERGIKTFYEVGTALADIRDRRLYRQTHGTFEDYCQRRWQMSRAHAYRMIEAAEVVSPIGDTDLPLPANEGQARELARIPEPDRAEVWRAVIERADGKPTAAAIRETYTARTTATPEPEPDDLLSLAGLETVTPTVTVRADPEPVPEPAKPKRRPLPEVLAEAARDYTRAAEKLARLTEDNRFPKNRDTTHHQLSDLVRALEDTAKFLTATHPAQAAASEEARRWWATSLHKTSDALTDVAHSLEQEKQ